MSKRKQYLPWEGPSRFPKGPLESAIEKKVVDWAVTHLGAKTRKMNGLGFRGWPDRLVLLPMCQELWIEFKRIGEEASPSQRNLHGVLRAQGREVWVENRGAEAAISKLSAWYVQQLNERGIKKPAHIVAAEAVKANAEAAGVVKELRAKRKARRRP